MEVTDQVGSCSTCVVTDTLVDAQSIGAVWTAPAGDGRPQGWDSFWGKPPDMADALPWLRIKRASEELAAGIKLLDRRDTFGDLVGSEDLRSNPVHRWLPYKEGFSPRLLGTLLDSLSLDRHVVVVDQFAGVGTTALAAMVDPRVAGVYSVEYSPFAWFAGRVKLSWPLLDPNRLRGLLVEALDYNTRRPTQIPELAAFSNERIFHPQRVRALLRVRDHLRELRGADELERNFFLLGLGAVIEDLSGAMKDGRALRILYGRRRRPTSLGNHRSAVPVWGPVKRTLAGQWTAMIEDLECMDSLREHALAKPVFHFRGDARHLSNLGSGALEGLPAMCADVACFSPPYLNCIDYTEVHKLELWLLGHVTNQIEFKNTRLGSLRSHPSVQFPERGYFDGIKADVTDTILDMSRWVTKHGARSEVGPIIRGYFEDMFQVWREAYRVLRPGGVAACIVANSTFSRRARLEGGRKHEVWRLPVLTDVILAHLARLAGFSDVELWHARDLRPRNVSQSSARESVVVARKKWGEAKIVSGRSG